MLDYSLDYLLWDFPEAATLTSVRDGQDLTAAVTHALRGQPSIKERAPTGGVYTGTDLLWLLPGVLLGGLTPKPGDTVTDAAGVIWTILQPEYDQLDQMWQCYAVALAIAHDLRDRVTLWKPATEQDAAGSRSSDHVQVGPERSARVQLVSEAPAEGRGKKLWVRTWRVYLAAEAGRVTHEWQVRDADGVIYEPSAVENRSRIDELSVIVCVTEGD